MEQPQRAIVLSDLCKDYGTTAALRGVTLEVPRGSIFGYVGPNGAGKTTTIKILTGILAPTRGDAFVLGHDVKTQALAIKAAVGYVPESGAVFDKFSPAEYLTLIGRLHRLSDDVIADRVDSWLKRFGLDRRRNLALGELSKGMRQKVCWISALLHEPEVLILDEPLSGLDVEAVALTKTLMAELAQGGKTVLYSSHLMDVVSRVCSHVAVLHRGQIAASGTIEEVLAARGAPSLEQALLALAGTSGAHDE